jgi:hypothetical protein
MKKLFTTLSIVFIFFVVNNAFSQSRTPAPISVGLYLNADFATNDAYGAAFGSGYNFGAIWGRGVSLTGKFGLGQKRSSRIVVSAEYNKMINSNEENKTPLLMNPNPPHTFYDIISGSVGYEYVFRSTCPDRQYLGLMFTVNNISAPDYNYYGEVESSMRFGLALTGGYEWVFGANRNIGLNIGIKYNVMNMFNDDNSALLGNKNLNDGPNAGGPGFKRYFSVVTANAGINFYFGQK